MFNVSFSENTIIWNKDAYEFGIFNVTGKNSPNDMKLKNTVIAIIEEFFHDNPNVLLYQCETGDSKQSARARLFLRWFDDYPQKDKFFIKVVMIKDEGIENYDAIIVQKNNPNIDSIVSEFEKFAKEMQK